MPKLHHEPNPQPDTTDPLQDHNGWLTQLAQLPTTDYHALADTIRNLDPDQLRDRDRKRNRKPDQGAAA